MTPRAALGSGPLPLAAGLVAGMGVAALVGPDVPLTRDRSFAVTAPGDGAEVGGAFTLRWTGSGAAQYAVVVDAVPPAVGRRVEPGDRVLVLAGTSLRLSLGDATSGSPSARRHHRLTVVPLDGAGRRSGEAVATVSVRGRG